MAAELAVSDTDPIIHLSEVGQLKAFGIVRYLLIPPEVGGELRRGRPAREFKDLGGMGQKRLTGRGEDRAAGLVRGWGLQLGEADAIALSLDLGIRLIFTDDLDARTVVKRYGLKPYGSVGILLRAYRERVLTREAVIEALRSLHSRSSLYLTSDLTKRAIEAVKYKAFSQLLGHADYGGLERLADIGFRRRRFWLNCGACQKSDFLLGRNMVVGT